MRDRSNTPRRRMKLRAIDCDEKGRRVRQIIEQDIPATAHEIGLALRRNSFRDLIVCALMNGGVATLEVKK